MILVYGFESYTLEAMNPTYAPSPEEFLSALEEQLEAGDITEEEAVQTDR